MSTKWLDRVNALFDAKGVDMPVFTNYLRGFRQLQPEVYSDPPIASCLIYLYVLAYQTDVHTGRNEGNFVVFGGNAQYF